MFTFLQCQISLAVTGLHILFRALRDCLKQRVKDYTLELEKTCAELEVTTCSLWILQNLASTNIPRQEATTTAERFCPRIEASASRDELECKRKALSARIQAERRSYVFLYIELLFEILNLQLCHPIFCLTMPCLKTISTCVCSNLRPGRTVELVTEEYRAAEANCSAMERNISKARVNLTVSIQILQGCLAD